MFDLGCMRSVHVDPQEKTVWVEGGCLLGDMDHETDAYDLAAGRSSTR
jgi:FAD/FMN-containing dehydrogenase